MRMWQRRRQSWLLRVSVACFEAVELNLRRQLQIARLHWAALCAGTPQVTLAVMDPRLRSASLKGDLAALNRALDEGADPNLADADGYNPLYSTIAPMCWSLNQSSWNHKIVSRSKRPRSKPATGPKETRRVLTSRASRRWISRLRARAPVPVRRDL